GARSSTRGGDAWRSTAEADEPDRFPADDRRLEDVAPGRELAMPAVPVLLVDDHDGAPRSRHVRLELLQQHQRGRVPTQVEADLTGVALADEGPHLATARVTLHRRGQRLVVAGGVDPAVVEPDAR